MKLIRFGEKGAEKPGIILDGEMFDVSSLAADYDERFFENNGLEKLRSAIEQKASALPEIPPGSRLGCPVARPSKIVCTGLNYREHAQEMVQKLPTEPVIFLKATSAITGPFDPIVIPKNSTKTDWEVELAVVISRRCSYVPETEAIDYVAGFMVHNDISEREFQLERHGTWDKGKGCDTFAPLGPWLVTCEEIKDFNNLKLWLRLNGRLMQEASTSSMIFKIPYIISYISHFMTLLPGDIISTGSPAGVGKGQDPPFYLKAGDIVELGIEGLGTARQEVKDYSPEKNDTVSGRAARPRS